MMTSTSKVIMLTGLAVGLLFSLRQPAHAIPAFARKYGLPCSAFHEAWPKLNDFGIALRDRGYHLGNEKDSPIWQNPSYWPITMRITPQWHRESSSNQVVDTVPGNSALGQTFQNVTTHSFDFGGVDISTAGALYKDISFSLLPLPILLDPFILKTYSFVLTDSTGSKDRCSCFTGRIADGKNPCHRRRPFVPESAETAV